MIFLRATRKISFHIALESGTLALRLLGIGEPRLAEMDRRRRIHGSSFDTTARYEGSRVIQAFAATHANKNIVEIPKNNLADLVSATPSVGPTSEMRNEVVALMNCTVERMTATNPCPDIKDWRTVGPKREATAVTEVCM
jgi:hypothetical protein